MRVLLVAAATSTTGGGERHVADLLHRLPEVGIEVGLVCPAGGELPTLAARLGIPFHYASVESMSIAAVGELRDAIRTFRPHIVHAHGSRAAFYARRADPKAARRVVYTLHGIHVDQAGSRLRRAVLLAVERRLVSRTAAFITVCDSDARKGARLGVLAPERTTTVYNGIDTTQVVSGHGGLRAELGIDSHMPLALSVGRFHEQKDQTTLLRAWSELVHEVPDVVLALVGSGQLESELRTLADALSLGTSVRFVAPRPDLAPAYDDADVFVLSSRWEGLPYVVLEAMAAGLPVASTDVDGIPEAVVSGTTGILVPPGDAGSLAEALRALLADPDLRTRMGEAGRARVAERFSLDAMVDGVTSVYESVIPTP